MPSAMQRLTPAALLAVWERGLTQTITARALMLLAAAFPETSPAVLAAMSIGRRDALLLQLRARLFGDQLAGAASCPKCSERLEFNFTAAEIFVWRETPEHESQTLAAGGFELEFRLPTSLDLMALSRCIDPQAARAKLLQRCLFSAKQNGATRTLPQLPEDVLAGLAARMAELDPQAEIKFSLACAACGQKWQALFDIAHFLWAEIHSWAPRLLRDVHLLAAAYGWSETDILQLSPLRRQFYLELHRR